MELVECGKNFRLFALLAVFLKADLLKYRKNNYPKINISINKKYLLKSMKNNIF